MVLTIFDDIVSGLNAGATSIWHGAQDIASVVGTAALNVLENAFNMIVSFIIGLIDGVSLVFGFKVSEVFSQITSFIIGTAKFCTKVFTVFPPPFDSLFATAFIFVLGLFIYRVIRG